MIVEFDKSFEKSIAKIKSRTLLQKIENVILKTENAAKIEDIPNSKKLSGYLF